MSKLSVFIISYSIVLIALFCTLCYLMTTVNPSEIKPDTYRARKFGIFQDDFIYPNDRLPSNDNDNIGYGLEKVDYDAIEIEPEAVPSSTSVRPEMPSTVKHLSAKIFQDKTNCSRKDLDVMKMITKPMKTPVKGFRRSISENTISLDNPRSLLLKINDVDGKPQIEIKVLKILRRFKSSGNENNNYMNISDIDYDDINKTVINVNENETLVIKINTDSIEYNKTVDLLDDETGIRNDSNKITTTSETTKQDGEYTNNITNISLVNSTEFNLPNITQFNTRDNTTLVNFEDSVQEVVKEVIEDAPTVNWIGLLIPEATATLPYNYHFIT